MEFSFEYDHAVILMFLLANSFGGYLDNFHRSKTRSSYVYILATEFRHTVWKVCHNSVFVCLVKQLQCGKFRTHKDCTAQMNFQFEGFQKIKIPIIVDAFDNHFEPLHIITGGNKFLSWDELCWFSNVPSRAPVCNTALDHHMPRVMLY